MSAPLGRSPNSTLPFSCATLHSRQTTTPVTATLAPANMGSWRPYSTTGYVTPASPRIPAVATSWPLARRKSAPAAKWIAHDHSRARRRAKPRRLTTMKLPSHLLQPKLAPARTKLISSLTASPMSATYRFPFEASHPKLLGLRRP